MTIRVFPSWIAHCTFWGAHLSSVVLWELIMYYRLLDLSLVICFVNISSRLVAFTQLVVFQQTELINFNIVKFIHLFLHDLCLFCLDKEIILYLETIKVPVLFTFRSKIHPELFFEYAVRWNQVSFYLIDLAPFFRHHPPSAASQYNLCHRLSIRTCLHLFLDSLLCSPAFVLLTVTLRCVLQSEEWVFQYFSSSGLTLHFHVNFKFP